MFWANTVEIYSEVWEDGTAGLRISDTMLSRRPKYGFQRHKFLKRSVLFNDALRC
jgi:hypothetical protein